MKLKEETKIALGVIAFIYVTFTALKTFYFFELSLHWHILTSLLGLVFIGLFGYIVRGIDIYLDRIYPFERNAIKRIAIQFLVTLSVLTIIRALSFLLLHDRFPYRPSNDVLVATYALNVFMILSVILSIFGYHFFVRWKQEKIAAAELEKEKSQVQYDNLKNQLNPHFLFNALSSLNSLIFENPQLASDFVQQLSKVYRYVLESKDKNAVSLDTEVEFVSHYVKLLEARFDEGIRVEFDIAEDVKEKKIVPVTLQILLENAVKHNSTNRQSPLHILIKNEGDILLVRNNLQRKNAMDISNKHGLANLKSLYSYISATPVAVEETTDYFTVKIPLS